MHGKGLNPMSLGRWLKDHLVDAPINGRVLRSANDRKKHGVLLDRGPLTMPMRVRWRRATGGALRPDAGDAGDVILLF